MNRSLSIAVAAFFAFITAVIFTVLFWYGLLPFTQTIGIAGVVISAVIIALMFAALAFCNSADCRKPLNNALGCFGQPVVFAAVISLILSMILTAINTAEITTVILGIVFAAVFLLVLTVFMVAFLITQALPACCNTNTNCNTANTNGSNCCNYYSYDD